MLNEEVGSFKELYDVHLKATQDVEIGNKSFQIGETIALFDKIQIAGLSELKRYVAARGGYDNRDHVYWETTEKLRLNFSQGVFSKTQFGLLNNAKIIQIEEEQPLLITTVEEIESNESALVITKHDPVDQIFVYNKETGEKIEWWKIQGKIGISQPYLSVLVSYRYNYTNGANVAKIGQKCLQGFVELEGKTRVKDDTSGLITTGIIKIPKLKLMSGLSIRLGAQANPVVGTFEGIGVPVESRHNSYVMEIDFLNDDIDSEM